MRPVLSAASQRQFDLHHIQRGVSGLVLMENAGRGAAHLVGLKLRPRRPEEAPRTGSSVVGSCIRCADERSLEGAEVTVVCGSGNNGGDGFVVARHLMNRGTRVRLFCLSPSAALRGDAQTMARAFEATGGFVELLGELRAMASERNGEETEGGVAVSEEFQNALASASLVVDALLGTGLSRPVQGLPRAVIEAMNACAAPVIALDLPSGLDATSGKSWGATVMATHTISFAHLKTGLLTTHGHAHGGNLTVSHIGVPSDLPVGIAPSAWLLEESDVAARIRPREATDHKGRSGRVGVVAGSPGTIGAARLCTRAALRGGAGLVTLCNRAAVVERFEAEAAEVMTQVIREDDLSADTQLDRFDSLVVGPGLGCDAFSRGVLRGVLAAQRPTVVDADALTLLSTGAVSWREVHELCVLTPHPGEAARLLDTSIHELESDRWGSVASLSERAGCAVLLKGSRPLLQAPGREPVVSAFGSAALATGGSGDVLCGLLAAFFVGVETPQLLFDRVLAAVGVQGMAAEAWSAEHGDRGLLASEVADRAPAVMARLARLLRG